MQQNDDWTSVWSCEKLVSHSDVLMAKPVGGNLIELTVKKLEIPVSVVTMSRPVVSVATLPACCQNPEVEFVLNIQKDALFERDVIEFAASRSFGIGGLGDLYTAVNEKEFREYLPKEVRFILRGLRQHTAVSSVELTTVQKVCSD